MRLAYRIADVKGIPAKVTLKLQYGSRVVKKVVLLERPVNQKLTYACRCALRPGRYRLSVTAVNAAGTRSLRAASAMVTVR